MQPKVMCYFDPNGLSAVGVEAPLLGSENVLLPPICLGGGKWRVYFEVSLDSAVYMLVGRTGPDGTGGYADAAVVVAQQTDRFVDFDQLSSTRKQMLLIYQ